MINKPRRPPLIGANRIVISHSSTAEHSDRATVINATALPRSLSYNNTTSLNKSSNSSSLVNPYDRIKEIRPISNERRLRMEPTSSVQARELLARDPFVSISRAIQSTKLRAGANLRAIPINKHHQRPARCRFVYNTLKTTSRLLSVALILCIIVFILLNRWWGVHDSSIDAGKSSTWSSSQSSHGDTSRVRHMSALEYEMRHRPSAHNLPSLQDGPWLIALISDLDKESCRERDISSGRLTPVKCMHANTWVSFMKRGILDLSALGRNDTGNSSASNVLTWLDEIPLENVRPVQTDSGRTHSGSRGMELSELVWFNGHLLTPDDRTGALLEILSPHGTLNETARSLLPSSSSRVPPSVRQQVLLYDADGLDTGTPFKAEWMVVKDDSLIIGGHGRPYTDARDGVTILSNGPRWVKSINSQFEVSHVNWSAQFDALMSSVDIRFPGYLMHEAVLWSHERREWVFLPRRRSKQSFDAESVMRRGWNGVITASEDFTSLRYVVIQGLSDSSGLRGFSSAKFLPGSRDRLIAALRTVEVETQKDGVWLRETASFISVFDILTGDMKLDETKVSDLKYEGLAFI